MQAPRIRCGLAAFRRSVLRDQRPRPIQIRAAALRRFLQDPGQVAAGIKVILFCRLNQTKQNCAALGSVCPEKFNAAI